MSRSWVEVDIRSIQRNVETLRAVSSGADLCAVVKADGYGHGSIRVAEAALAGGASGLAVAQVGEGVRLREAGLDAPIWVLSEPAHDEFETAATFELEPAIYSKEGVAAAASLGRGSMLKVHLKVDTGMHRSGAHPEDAIAVAERIERTPGLHLASVWTHCAVADEPMNPFTDEQIDRFESVLTRLAANGLIPPMVHAANSAATMAHPRAHFDVVRCGIAIYGLAPSPALRESSIDLGLVPALRWLTTVSFVKRLQAGDRVSYGQLGIVKSATTVATIPVGYADGYRRATWRQPGTVLIGGKQRNIIGVVTMDQLVVDVGNDDVQSGDEVVLLGGQDDCSVSADDLATAQDTINYEVTCAISARVERRTVGQLV